MKVSESWLHEWVPVSLTTEELTEQLTIAGLEVDSVTPAAPPFEQIVVGEVISAMPHPNADKLRVCRVEVGEKLPLDIVCGAKNVRQGLKVAVAKIGCVMPSGMKIKAAKLRGSESQGMICSESELGLAETSYGIMELPSDAPVGQSIRDYLGLDDVVIDFEITPNRGDCLSIHGIAREVCALHRVTLIDIDHVAIAADIEDTMPAKVTAKQAAPNYLTRTIKNINTGAVTPIWMAERLRRAGLRLLHPVVDVINYVMLELGQPMHAFDHAKIDNAIHVRMAKSGESITLLDEQTVTLTADDLVIADKNQPIALAGVMGGLDSAVSSETTDIVLESAFFDPVTITRTARRYGLHTDSSHRFERGVDSGLQERALERATKLLHDIVGGEVGPIEMQTNTESMPKLPTVTLRRTRIARLLGITISDSDVERMLSDLGMTLMTSDEGWQVAPPSARFDIHQECDLIEEIARIYGYGNLPTQQMTSKLRFVQPSMRQERLATLRQLLVSRGYHEVITYNFIAQDKQSDIDPTITPITLKNPLSPELAVMRTSLWPGLLQNVVDNRRRQISRVRTFEVGACYQSHKKAVNERIFLSGVVSGQLYPEQWGVAGQAVDLFDVKSDVEAMISMLGLSGRIEFRRELHEALHPGKSARIYMDNKACGWLGDIHPRLAKKLGLESQTIIFEIDLYILNNEIEYNYNVVSKMPSMRRDIAIVVDTQILAGDITKKITESASKLLKKVQIFDIYSGEGVDLGRKSIALGLTFQLENQTLTDEQVDKATNELVAVLQTAFNATLRT